MKRSVITGFLKSVRAYLAASDFSILLVLLVMIAGSWVFLEISDEYREGETNRFDIAVLQFMRTAENTSIPKGPDWLFPFMRDITALGSGSVISLVTLIVIGYMLLLGRISHAVLMGVISGGGAGLV